MNEISNSVPGGRPVTVYPGSNLQTSPLPSVNMVPQETKAPTIIKHRFDAGLQVPHLVLAGEFKNTKHGSLAGLDGVMDIYDLK